MPPPPEFAYGTCPCGGKYQSRTVDVTIKRVGGESVVLQNIPQGACPICGSRVYKSQVLRRIEAVVRVTSHLKKDHPGSNVNVDRKTR